MRTILAWICLASVVESLLLIFNININRICITQIPVEFQPVVFPKDSCFQKLHIPTSPHPTNSTPHSADHLPGGLKPSTWNNKSRSNPPDCWFAVFSPSYHSLAIVSCCKSTGLCCSMLFTLSQLLRLFCENINLDSTPFELLMRHSMPLSHLTNGPWT